MNIRSILLVLAVTAATTITPPQMVNADERTVKSADVPVSDILPKIGIGSGAAWIMEPWSGDDRPFAAARRYIDRLFDAHVDARGVLAGYDRKAQAAPNDALAQFSWAYTAYRQMEVPHAAPANQELFDRLSAALANAAQPHTYNYDRLRLLVQPRIWDERLLSERLLAQDANDVPVESAYAEELATCRSATLGDMLKGIDIETRIVGSGMDKPRCYCLLAEMEAAYGFVAHSPDYYRKAIAANDQYLSLSPAYDWRRPLVLHSNDVLQRRLDENK